MPSKKLTGPQAALLSLLPDLPSDGKDVRGASVRVADYLCARGLAKCVGCYAHVFYYVRTKACASLVTSGGSQWRSRRSVCPSCIS